MCRKTPLLEKVSNYRHCPFMLIRTEEDDNKVSHSCNSNRCSEHRNAMNHWGDSSDLTIKKTRKVRAASAAKIATQDREQGEGGNNYNVFTTPRSLHGEQQNVDNESDPSPPSTSRGVGGTCDELETAGSCAHTSSSAPLRHFMSTTVRGRPLSADEYKMLEDISSSREIVGDLGDPYIYLNRLKDTPLPPPKLKKNSE